MITHDDVSLLLFRSLLRKRWWWWWWWCRRRRRLAASRGSPLFRVRARRRHALSRFVFGYIYIKMELEKCNRICCLQFFIVVTKRFATTNTLSLSLPKTNETLFWSSLLLLTTTTTISSSLKVVSFLIHTYKMRTRSTTNRTHVVLSVLKGVMTDDDGARRPTQRRQFWRRRLWRTKRRRPSSGRDETHYLDYPTVLYKLSC